MLSLLVEFFQGVTGEAEGGILAILLVVGLGLAIADKYEEAKDDGKGADKAP
jgi:hypothetical protein